MRIVCTIKGHYHWEKIPVDVKVTPEDIEKKRVKEMASGDFRMKVVRTIDHEGADKGRTFDCGIHEAMIQEKLAAHEYIGKDLTREEMIAVHLRDDIFPDNLHRQHLVSISVHDDGPDEEGYKRALAAVGGGGVTGEHAVEALARYMESENIEDYLNRVFKCGKYAKVKK